MNYLFGNLVLENPLREETVRKVEDIIKRDLSLNPHSNIDKNGLASYFSNFGTDEDKKYAIEMLRSSSDPDGLMILGTLLYNSGKNPYLTFVLPRLSVLIAWDILPIIIFRRKKESKKPLSLPNLDRTEGMRAVITLCIMPTEKVLQSKKTKKYVNDISNSRCWPVTHLLSKKIRSEKKRREEVANDTSDLFADEFVQVIY